MQIQELLYQKQSQSQNTQETLLLAVLSLKEVDLHTQVAFYQRLQAESTPFISGAWELVFVSTATVENLEQNLQIPILKDDENFLLSLTKQKNLTSDNYLLFLEISGEKIDYLTHRDKLEKEINWPAVTRQFAINFYTQDPDNGYYRWGQKVPRTGDYLCKDCGYVLTLNAGSVFPICEVCFSGDPNSPDGYAKPAEGFWEAI